MFEIRSSTQNDKLADYAMEIVGEGRNFWQGLTDTETDGVWTFVSDGSTIGNYENWRTTGTTRQMEKQQQ